jgi:ketosteroid isomerase-like protein
MHVDPDTIEEASTATRAAVLDHLDAFNSHDTDRLIAGLHQDVVWATGSDVFRGTRQLRNDVFDEGLWAMRPSLAVRTLLVEGEAAAGTFHEVLTVNDELRTFDIAVFFTVHDAVIRTVKVFREGSADITS